MTSRDEILKRFQLRKAVKLPNYSNDIRVRVMSFLLQLKNDFGYPKKIITSATELSFQALDVKIKTHHYGLETVVCACVYIICRNNDYQCSLKDYQLKYNLDYNHLCRMMRKIKRELDIFMKLHNYEAQLYELWKRLEMSYESREVASNILQEAVEKRLVTGKHPRSIIGSILYTTGLLFGGKDKKTQEQIAKITGLTEVTIRNNTKKLCEKLDIPINPRKNSKKDRNKDLTTFFDERK